MVIAQHQHKKELSSYGKYYSVEEADKTCSRPGHSRAYSRLACDVALDTYSF